MNVDFVTSAVTRRRGNATKVDNNRSFHAARMRFTFRQCSKLNFLRFLGFHSYVPCRMPSCIDFRIFRSRGGQDRNRSY